jgi:hemerythrin-like domain-containing protein
MNNNGITLLLAEHDVISRVENLIPRLDGHWKISREGYEAAVNLLISFFREYGDKFHHYKEEQVLFPKLNSNFEFSQPTLLEELEDHHEMFREYMASLETSLRAQDYEKVQSTLQSYTSDLLDHIAAENDELFVMAESLLSEEELEAMYFDFEDFDRQIGTEIKRQLAEIPDTIERILSK